MTCNRHDAEYDVLQADQPSPALEAESASGRQGVSHPIKAFLRGARDLMRGLFPLSTRSAPPDCDYAAALEERYSKPRRCC